MSGKQFIIERYDVNKTYFQQKTFDCGNKVINKFVHASLKKQVRNGFSQAYVLLDQDNNERFSAFYTLASFKLLASDMAAISADSFPRDIPCVRLIMLGAERELQGQGIGKKIISDALHRVYKASKEVGVFGVYLDADPNAINFYHSLGFVRLDNGGEKEIAKMFLSMNKIHALLS